MKIMIEFYRTREADDAHAVLGRETAEAADLDDAIEIARPLGWDPEHAAARGRHDDRRREWRNALFGRSRL